jgi:hypothetical protein
MLRVVARILKNTHRHPANRALHLAGLPVYVAGLAKIAGFFIGLQADPMEGVLLWTLAISMFVSGHMIEGNARSMTPVLLFRVLARSVKSGSNHAKHRVHLFRS